MNAYAAASAIKRLAGYSIRLGLMESFGKSEMDSDRIVVAVNRARTKETRNGLIVTHRGTTLYEFKRNPDTGRWAGVDPLTVWWSTGDELHVTYPGLTPTEHAARTEWEDMCHRPGTPTHPLDNADRRAQGIK